MHMLGTGLKGRLCMRRKPTMDFIKAMQELTPQDISKLVTKMLKTPPTVAVLGDIANVPRYDAIASRFR